MVRTHAVTRQLAVDLLVSSTGADRVGYLDDPNLLPCVGNDAYGPLPFYESSSTATTLAQQRSPVAKPVTLRGPQVYYLSNAEASERDDHCERLGFGRLDEYDSEERCWKYLSSVFEENCKEELTFHSEDELEDIDYYPSLPFAALFSAFKARGLKVTCLLCYCSEGDNIPDAFFLAEAASKLTSLSPDKFHGKEVGNGRYRIHGRACMELLRICPCFRTVLLAHIVRHVVVD
ncbi:hypothetical protein Bca4012_066739 [Brassica carinata]